MPAHSEQTRCFKNLWDYDLHYIGDTFDGVIQEIERSRDNCPGFMPYEAGLTPAKHLEIQFEQMKRRPEKGGLTWLQNKKGDVLTQLAEVEKSADAQEERKEVTLEANEPTSFTHSPDFCSITKDGETFTLTPKQGQIIKILFEARERKNPTLRQDYILNEVSPDTSTKRLRDIFKRNFEAFKTLIEPGEKKGTFRLKK
jgi:hypothetical protein